MSSELVPSALETTPQHFLNQPRAVAAGRSFQWWVNAWEVFKAEPGTWVVIGLVFLVLSLVLQFIPFLNLFGMILANCFIGGWMLACARQYDGEKPDISDLFAGFQKKFVSLVLLGLVTVALSFVALILALLPFGSGLLALLFSGSQNFSFTAAFGGFGLTLVLVLALLTPVIMASFFSPVLIMLHDYNITAALKTSLKACAINWLPLTLYGLFFVMFSLIASLLLGLGWLVLMPLIFLSIYQAYRDIFYQM